MPQPDDAVSFLTSRGVMFDAGLSDNEVAAVEERFGFRFPPDLRAFLQTALPVAAGDGGKGVFPDWRNADALQLRERLAWPFEGIAFDIENNVFWWDQWGPKPDRLQDAIAVAQKHVAAAPMLIPVYSHRYIPAEPHLSGNPIFSTYQTDIIFYGYDLWDYFRNEFAPVAKRGKRCHGKYSSAHRTISFWTEMVRANNGG